MRAISVRHVLPLALMISACLSAYAQTTDYVTASFGSFYGLSSNGYPSVNVNVPTQGMFSNPVLGSNCMTSEGTVAPPSSWSNTLGRGATMIPIKFQPSGLDGSFSGTCTATYSNTYNNPSTSLTLTISFSGTNMVPIATAGLKYKVLSIVYSPPGNASTNGFTNSASAGTTDSSTQNFSNTDSITFSQGFLGVTNSVTFSTSQAAGLGSSETTTYQASSSSQLGSVAQAIDHSQDQVYLLVDPSVTLTQTGSTTGFYSFGGSLDATGFQPGTTVPPDILNVNISGLQNPSLIPLALLEPQVPQPGVTLPGLSYICANPLPPAQCTQQNACGCTAADFAPIVAQDELASVTNQATAPNSIDATRFIYINNVMLQGPQQAGVGAVKTTYALSDSNVSSQTTSSGSTYAVGYTHSFTTPSDLTLGVSTANTFSFMQQQTVGTTNGTAHVGTATLGTSDVQCSEYVDVYEDTIYHTFAFALSQAAPPTCQ